MTISERVPSAGQPSSPPIIPWARWLPWAQAAVAGHLLLSLAMFLVGTPIFFEILTTPCAGDCAYFLQLTPGEVAALRELGLTLPFYGIYQIAQEVLYLIAFSLVGGIIYQRLVMRRDPQAWYGLLATLALGSLGTILLAETSLAASSLGNGWDLLYKLLKGSGVAAFYSFCLLFPDGRFVPRQGRWPLAACFLWLVAWIVLPLPELDPAGAIGIFPSLAMLLLIVVVQIYRYRSVSTPLQRQQTKWFVFGFGLTLTAVILWSTLVIILPLPPGPQRLAANLVGQGVLALFPVAFAATIGISLLRYRLWEIDLIVNRTLVYGGLTAIVVAAYTLVVGGLGTLLQARGNFAIALLATGFVAVLVQPLRERLQRGANRLMFGERDNPYAALSRLSAQLQTTGTPEAMLQSVVETIAATLKLPYVAVELAGTQERLAGAATGQIVVETVDVPLRYQGETVGYLVVSPRSPGESFTAREQQLLLDMAGQTGAMAYAVRLTADLQRSRERLVLAREEERRRIRRDLHDGLGPTLASQTFAFDAILALLESDPEEAARLLRGLKTQNQETVAEIRRLVYELRPPALDELGLVGALRAQAVRLSSSQRLQIDVRARPEPLPPLPAALEVATYRITLEAMTNVARHARARRCTVEVRVADGQLRLAIADDGAGLPPDHRPGVGLNSMSERAEELGGQCEIITPAEGGTRVTAHLPLTRVAI